MEFIYILLIGIVIGIFAIAVYMERAKRDVSKIDQKQNAEETIKRYIDKEENEFQKRQKLKAEMIENTNKIFSDIGWTEWDTSIHCADGQLDRMQKSLIPNGYKLLCYNPKTGNAKILSKSGKYYLTNGHRCSCPDFRERGLPCKHMYFWHM